MVTKIVTIASVALLALALIGGSAYVLLRPTAGEGCGSCTSHSDAAGAFQNRNGREATGEGAARSSGYDRHAAGSAGQDGRRGAWGSTGTGAEHPLELWTTITGTVITVDGSELAVEGDEGPLVVALGPAWYWESNGIPLSAGDEVELLGFEENSTFQVARLLNVTTGQTALLRDETGRPVWAGRGRGGG